MSKFEFSPVPQATDFDAAFTQVDAAIHREGGLSVVMGGESSFSIADQLAFEQDLAIAHYSTLFIPYESDRDDPGIYAPAHAFSRGYTMATPVNDAIYNGRYSFDDYYSSLNAWMVACGTENIQDDRQWFEANSLLLRKYSEGGLERIGQDATATIERWGSSLFVDPSLSRIFAMGCGALVMSGIIHQNTVNEYAIREDVASDVIDQGLARILLGGDEGKE